MNQSEKKWKQYLHSVRRRLNLPPDIRERVMSDLATSIEARREAGMTEEAILAQLGTPEEAAAELNEQMQEYTCRKSPWRFVFLAAAVLGALDLLGSVAACLLYLFLPDPLGGAGEAASLGIIGGADGPTAVFVTYTVPSYAQLLVPLALVAVGIWGYCRFKRCKRKKM